MLELMQSNAPGKSEASDFIIKRRKLWEAATDDEIELLRIITAKSHMDKDYFAKGKSADEILDRLVSRRRLVYSGYPEKLEDDRV